MVYEIVLSEEGISNLDDAIEEAVASLYQEASWQTKKKSDALKREAEVYRKLLDNIRLQKAKQDKGEKQK